MFNIKLEENSYKMSFKALPVKIQWSKNRHGGHNAPPTRADRVKETLLFFLRTPVLQNIFSGRLLLGYKFTTEKLLTRVLSLF